MTKPNGWGDLDPVLRALRAVAIIAFLILLAVVVLDPGRRDQTLTFLLFGSILLALGYPVALRIPGAFVSKPPPEDKPDE